MRFCSLGSGSGGNAHVVEQGETTLLFECGFAGRTLKKKLTARYLSPAEISAVFVSHEHGDHTRGLKLMAQYGVPCYMSAGTARAVGEASPDLLPSEWRCLTPDCAVTVGSLTVTPVPVPHDAREPLQFVVEDGARKLTIMTDLGHVSRAAFLACCEADALVVECNYDEEMLRTGPYPENVKERIAGDYGHLSNAAAARLVAALPERRRQVIAAHLSANNNREDLVRHALAGAAARGDEVRVALQDEGIDWIEVGVPGGG